MKAELLAEKTKEYWQLKREIQNRNALYQTELIQLIEKLDKLKEELIE